MNRWRIVSLAGLGVLLAFGQVFAGETQAEVAEGPVNRVDISELLSTSGQPSAAYFSDLAEQGFELVINLAPPQSLGSLSNEGALVADHGIVYVNIPVDWDKPDPAQFEFFGKLLNANRALKTLVHCQVGFRASTFTFLYRVIFEQASADEALEAVHQVWVPNGTWTAFANGLLADSGSDFELLQN